MIANWVTPRAAASKATAATKLDCDLSLVDEAPRRWALTPSRVPSDAVKPHQGGAAMQPTMPDGAPVAPASAKPKASRVGTKQDAVIAMLRKPDGASLDEIIAATGWQPHTVRGAISGALKKKLGLAVASDRVEGRGRVYRLAP